MCLLGIWIYNIFKSTEVIDFCAHQRDSQACDRIVVVSYQMPPAVLTTREDVYLESFHFPRIIEHVAEQLCYSVRI